MKTNTEFNQGRMYEHVKERVKRNLEEQEFLQESTIPNIIQEWKKIIKETPPQFLKTVLGVEDPKDIRILTELEWKYIQNELEQSFNVRIETGVLVTGEEQKNKRFILVDR